MELLTVKKNQANGVVTLEDVPIIVEHHTVSTDKPFILANTEEATLEEIRERHLIPVYIKSNEPLISQSDFIETTQLVVSEFYVGETILSPSIRVSHPIKNRIPEAKNKPANELLEHEKTLYFDRLAFLIEVPTIYEDIAGNRLSLTIGGVKAYNLDNLYSKKGAENFKIFVGFQNKVCTNLCLWTDGLMNDLRVSSIGQLKGCIRLLLENYNAVYHLKNLRKLNDYSLTEAQFAHLIGRARMYSNLTPAMKSEIPPLLFGDTQVGAVCKDFYKDESFCKDENGNISLWKLYNLLTGVNKSSYLDTFLEKSVNAFHFTEQIRWALENKSNSWFLN